MQNLKTSFNKPGSNGFQGFKKGSKEVYKYGSGGLKMVKINKEMSHTSREKVKKIRKDKNYLGHPPTLLYKLKVFFKSKN